ncbi:MAG: DUF4062 domain-containing protein [Candidatus Latescibacterota bacterium]
MAGLLNVFISSTVRDLVAARASAAAAIRRFSWYALTMEDIPATDLTAIDGAGS